jgi:hypothetical protein
MHIDPETFTGEVKDLYDKLKIMSYADRRTDLINIIDTHDDSDLKGKLGCLLIFYREECMAAKDDIPVAEMAAKFRRRKIQGVFE